MPDRIEPRWVLSPRWGRGPLPVFTLADRHHLKGRDVRVGVGSMLVVEYQVFVTFREVGVGEFLGRVGRLAGAVAGRGSRDGLVLEFDGAAGLLTV